jgi:hypothetical protein
MRKTRPVIALVTDFGLADNFVGVMKGVIARHCPQANVIDVAHGIPPQSVMRAALALLGSYRHFPEGTIFAVVVDPGVGSERKIIAVKTAEYVFLAPDNGVLSPVVRESKGGKFYEVTYRPEGLSDTFHGRDIFAPVAGMLAAGKPIEDFAREIPAMAEFELPKPKRAGANKISGSIVYVDTFGNCMSNIPRSVVRGKAKVRIGKSKIDGISKSYAEKETGQALAIFNSFDMLEIAVNRGSAAERLGMKIGTEVVVEFEK